MNKQHILEFADRVREAVEPNAYDLISQHIPGAIKNATGGKWRSHCPFHTSDNPSYSFSFNAKGQYRCFSCEAFGGSAVKFLMDISGRSHLETILDLAEQYHIEPPDRDSDAWQAEIDRRNRDRRLRKIVAIASTFYRFELDRNPAARQYLRDRHITEAIADQFRLGYAPRGNPLISKLASQGFTEDDMVAAGVCRRADNGQVFDFFRDRLILPICDDRGNPIAIAGRSMDGSEPKYLNTPDTSIFHKQQITYGLHHAKPLWKKDAPLVLTEGYFDAIALLSQGIPAGAVMGTGLTASRAFALSRQGAIAIGFDDDPAGQRAVWRISDDARVRKAVLGGDIALTVVRWHPAKDPDQLLQSAGADAVTGAIAAAQPYVIWAIRNIETAYEIAPPPDREPLRRKIAELLGDIPSPVERLERQREMAMLLAPGDPELQQQIGSEARTVRRSMRSERTTRSAAIAYRPGETAELAIARCILHRQPEDWDLLDIATDAIAAWEPYWPALWDLIWCDEITAPQLELHPECPDFPAPVLRSLTAPNDADRATLTHPIATIREAATALQTELDIRHRNQELAWLLEENS